MKRRDFLKASGVLTANVLAGYTVTSFASLLRAEAVSGIPLSGLKGMLDPSQGVLLVPTDAKFAAYQIAFNKRVAIQPKARVICKTPEAVATTIKWARQNGVPFAIRGGGHSYEGFSQSSGIVIDVRGFKNIQVDAAAGSVSIGSGSALGEVYRALSQHGLVIPAGSCPTVGVAGHTLGGGFGLLARSFGLACDSVQSIEMVDADGQRLTASEKENPDLFWALRGGGSGQFGVVTNFQFKTHECPNVAIFGMSWNLPINQAVNVMKNWQDWIAQAPNEITCIFRVGRGSNNTVSLRCAGQSSGSESALRTELSRLLSRAPGSQKLMTSTKPFIEAVHHFAGDMKYPAVYMKAKSDYVIEPMSDAGIRNLMQGLLKLPPGAVVAICDSYGGAVFDKKSDETAFVHRDPTLYSIQYYSEWSSAAQTNNHLTWIRGLYDSMRSYVSGGAYVNYCDMDLKNYAEAYWGSNLARLKTLKAVYDPTNTFKHPQSL